MKDEDASPELRRFSARVVEYFIKAVDRQYSGDAVGPDLLRKTAAAFSVSPLLLELCQTTAKNLASEDISDPFQRLLLSPLAELFQTGEMTREIIPNYFNFIQLVMGERQEPLSNACNAIVAKMKSEPFPPFSWSDFLSDPRARLILWTVLFRVAESFKRFDVRQDWLIKLMQYDRQSVSLASNAFLPKPKGIEETAGPSFSNDDFKLLFWALFGPLRGLGDEEKMVFHSSLGLTVEQAFGPIWQHLEEIGVSW